MGSAVGKAERLLQLRGGCRWIPLGGRVRSPTCHDRLHYSGMNIELSRGDPEEPRFTALQGQYLAFIHNYSEREQKSPSLGRREVHDRGTAWAARTPSS